MMLSVLSNAKKRFAIICSLIILFAFFTRIGRISFPSSFYFDEVYHGFTATTFLHNDPKGYEFWVSPPQGVAYEWTHPPLAKLFMALGMLVLGENSVGWRISSVLFGTGVVALSGLLAHRLFKNQTITILTLLLLSFDGLLLTMSRIAMNDMHFVFFMLATIICYVELKPLLYNHKLEKKTVLLSIGAPLFFGLALASKWTMLYIAPALVIDLFLTSVWKKQLPYWKSMLMVVTASFLIPLVYIGSYTQFFFQHHTGYTCTDSSLFKSIDRNTGILRFSIPLPEFFPTQWKEKYCIWRDITMQMWWYHTGLKATHTYQSRPWQWILDIRPVWMHVDYSKNLQAMVANIYNVDNPLLLWTGLTGILTTVWLLFKQFIAPFALEYKPKKKSIPLSHAEPIQLLLICYFILWVPWIVSPRIMFFYHYSPAIPFMLILLARLLTGWMEKGKQSRRIVFLLLAAIAVGFVVLYPINTGLFMPQRYIDTLFGIFPSWR